MTLPRNAPAYDRDFVAWLEDQAARARRGEVEGLDLENIAEELEGLANTNRREIRSRMIVLLMHLLKHQFQPRRRSRGWLLTMAEQRRQIELLISDSPSLRSFPASVLDNCYNHAREEAAIETGLPETAFPEHCPFMIGDVLQSRWLP